jgi:hypothetical protein
MKYCQGMLVRVGIVRSARYVAIKPIVLRNRFKKTASWLYVRTPASPGTTPSWKDKTSVASYDLH